MKLTKRSLNIRFSKKSAVLIAASIVVLMVAAYATYSVLFWQSFEQKFETWAKDSSMELSRAVKRPLSEDFDSNQKTTNLSETSDRLLSQSESVCQPDSMVNWQEVIPAVGDIVDHCREKVSTVESDASSVERNLVYLKAESNLAAIISSAYDKSSKLESKPERWSDISKIWRQAADAAGDINGSDEFDPIGSSAKKSLTAIANSWEKLANAHGDENEAEFNAARNNLRKAYANLESINESSERVFKDTV